MCNTQEALREAIINPLGPIVLIQCKRYETFSFIMSLPAVYLESPVHTSLLPSATKQTV